jgi:hypothetical protein
MRRKIGLGVLAGLLLMGFLLFRGGAPAPRPEPAEGAIGAAPPGRLSRPDFTPARRPASPLVAAAGRASRGG